MKYDTFLQKCNEDDVLELNNQMVKLSKFKYDLNLAFNIDQNREALLSITKYVTTPSVAIARQLFNGDGVDANVLRIGSQGWKKGKLKINVTLEFCPDEPEIEEIMQSNDAEINQASSPLDDIRQMMNKDN